MQITVTPVMSVQYTIFDIVFPFTSLFPLRHMDGLKDARCTENNVEKTTDKPAPSQNANCDSAERRPLELVCQVVEQQYENDNAIHVPINRWKTDAPPDIGCKQDKDDNQHPILESWMRRLRRLREYGSKTHSAPQ